MNSILLVTAGHIDHGKTALVKALTGIDTDRLPEEKHREMTIDLGFSWLNLQEGKCAIVDVPGHKDLLKNMIAGVWGADAGLLVVSANEGIKPQTLEHWSILQAFEINFGIIVVTKIDLATKKVRNNLKQKLKAMIAGTTWETAPMVETSALTGEGLEELKSYLNSLFLKITFKGGEGATLLPIDRIFSLPGRGSIITGTLVRGKLEKGGNYQIFPGDIPVKVRSLQVHYADRDKVFPGERVGVNLSSCISIKRRGSWLVSQDYFTPRHRVYIKLKPLYPNYKIKQGEEVKLFIGTSNINVRLYIEKDFSKQDFLLVRVETKEPLLGEIGDKVLLKAIAPPVIIGGGKILGSLKEDLEYNLKELENPFPLPQLESWILENGKVPVSKVSKYYFSTSLDTLIRAGKIVLIGNYYFHNLRLEKLWSKAFKICHNYHSLYPYTLGILKQKLWQEMTPKSGSIGYMGIPEEKILQESLLAYWKNQGQIKIIKQKFVALSSFSPVLYPAQAEVWKLLENEARKGGGWIEFKSTFSNYKELLTLWQEEERIILLGGKFILLKEDIEKIKEKLKKEISSIGCITLARVRDLFNISRSKALLLLEYLDSIKFTRRVGDYRILI